MGRGFGRLYLSVEKRGIKPAIETIFPLMKSLLLGMLAYCRNTGKAESMDRAKGYGRRDAPVSTGGMTQT